MSDIKNYRIGYRAGGKKYLLDGSYTKKEAERQVALASLAELRPTQRGQIVSSDWFYEELTEVDICKYCRISMVPCGSSLADANGWQCPHCGHEEVEMGSYSLSGRETPISHCRCSNCQL